MSSSPLTSLSRTPAQAGFLGRDDLDAVLLVEAQHRGHHHLAQSVSGMKPMRTSFFSGASEPAAQAPVHGRPGGQRGRTLDELPAFDHSSDPRA
jgi:hypothetical protein